MAIRTGNAYTLAAASETPKSGKGDVRFRKQFFKTELCAFYVKGWCSKGTRCEFAHGEHEIQVAPDLTKTSLCRKWLQRACPLSSEECPFAHGARELRATTSYAVGDAAGSKGAESGKARKPKAPRQIVHLDLDEAVPASSTTPSAATLPPMLPLMPTPLSMIVAADPWSCPTPVPAAVPASDFSDFGAPSPQAAATGCQFRLELLATSPVSGAGAQSPCKAACEHEYQDAKMPAQACFASDPCAQLVASVATQAPGNMDLAALLLQAMPEVYED